MSLLQLAPMVTQLAAAVLLLLRKSAAMVSTRTFSYLAFSPCSSILVASLRILHVL